MIVKESGIQTIVDCARCCNDALQKSREQPRRIMEFFSSRIRGEFSKESVVTLLVWHWLRDNYLWVSEWGV